MDAVESLFKAYLEDAQVFAAAHLIVALLVFGSLANFARWKFDDEPTPTIWQQFDIRTNFIHGLIGLFLIVGIAGTFLGLWPPRSINRRPLRRPWLEARLKTRATRATRFRSC